MANADAYFVNPYGKIAPLENPRHINEIIQKPEKFGYTKEHIQDIYAKHNERYGQEGKAREEIIHDLLGKGFAHIRLYKNFWAVNVNHYDDKTKSALSTWAGDVLNHPKVGRHATARIYSLHKNEIVASPTVQDLYYGVKEEMENYNPIIVESCNNFEDLMYKPKLKTFRIYSEEMLLEGNPLWHKLEEWGSKGVHIGAVSPERSDMDDATRKMVNQKIVAHLENARQKGLIGGWSGPHTGAYQEDKDIMSTSKEKSYFVHAKSNSEEDHKNMLHTLYQAGDYTSPEKKDNQESILLVSPDRKVWWQYLRNSENPGKVEYQGTIEHNPKIGQGVGYTMFNRKSQYSFTSKKRDDYDPSNHPYIQNLPNLYKKHSNKK